MDIELKKMFPDIYKKYIFYQSNSNVWKNELKKLIEDAKSSDN